ncbi:serine/threonine-protein kinase 31 isoform X1 [Aplysia californica]|uniref:Serine/threonine-protein kinase 31 isoform X1 n=1 Tax=Aplysia californica TaxID=6500 RepID=A0ABM0JSL4_APLCA|nr:serine/threonine-protein kinase 31 isoform X1 [Aplysia californica]
MASITSAQNRRVTTFDVFVGNLPPDADQKKLGKVFSQFGEIHSIWINNSNDGNKFAFVKFYCEEDSLKAIEDTNGTLFEGGKPINVRKANKKGARRDGEQDGTLDKEDGAALLSGRRGNPDAGSAFEGSQESLQTPVMKKDTEKILVSHVETPVVIWGQRVNTESANELTIIAEQLAVICPEAPKLTGKPEMDKIYGAQFSEDGLWYRCTVRYVFGSDRVKVQYLDYGNTEEVSPWSLVELPKSVTALPPCGIKFMLHSLYTTSNQDHTAIKYLKDLVDGQEVEVFTTARLSDHTGFYAEVYANGINVCEKMVESSFCFKKPGLDQRGFKARSLGVAGDMGGMNSLGGVKAGFGMRDGLRKFDNDKDEISNLRWKLKSLQSEYTSLSNKAQENNLPKQIKTLQILSSNVRKLRAQFPVDRATPLDEAISLVQGPGQINLELAHSLPEVISCVQAYRSAQEEILKCSDGSILKDKIEARDQIRRDLHEKLGTAVEEINSLPLKDRGKRVQEVVATMSKHYDNFLKLTLQLPPSLESLLPAYEEWKAKKKVDVIGARRQSDTLESTVTTLLGQLQAQLSVSREPEEGELSEDLAGTLKAYSDVLQQEIAVWDSDNLQDSALIGSLAQLLLQDLRQESACVDQLTSMLSEFSAMREAVTPWLHSAPSLDKLQAVRSKLKSLKSKLRHKLADKADAEENQDTEELELVRSDLETIRGKIHTALMEEDNLLGELSTLAKDHFPELLNSEQDPGFGTYLMYKGLVKTSHAPDHYNLTPVPGASSGTFTSVYDGQAVLIKEYFLSDGNHLDKEDFLSQMGLFTNASSPHLQPVDAVFFDKNNRHAYVQVKKQGELLSTLLEQSVLTKQQVQSIVRSLCVALQALHVFNFVHGQIQPEFVMVDEEDTARLLPPDFSLTDADRCRSKYMTESNLELTAPEMKQSMIVVEPCHAIDVYCLGLMALWMHYPKVPFQENKNGVVDISAVQMDRNLGIFLTKLLCPNPLLRPTAESCLRSEYLNQAVVETTQGSSPLLQAMHGGKSSEASSCASPALEQDPARLSRSSASPASSSDGPLYTDARPPAAQLMANTRVPPPPLSGLDGLGQPLVSGGVCSPPMSTNHLHNTAAAPPPQHLQQQFMQQQQQQQLLQQRSQLQQQQQQQQQLQQCHPYQQQPPPPQQNMPGDKLPPLAGGHPTPSQDNGAFEIGTFDPTAYEVVTSPQPTTPVEGGEPGDVKGQPEEVEGEEVSSVTAANNAVPDNGDTQGECLVDSQA